MKRRYLLLSLMIATSAARAESWTYVGTLNDPVAIADGQYDARVTLLDSGKSSGRAKAIVGQPISIENGAFSWTLDLGEALQASAEQSVDSLVLTTEISSDGVHFVALSQSGHFDAVSAQRGVCWGSEGGSTSQASQIGTACLLPTALLAQMVPAGGAYELRKQVIAGGGRLVIGGSYALTGTVGQSAVARVSGGAYQLTGGFHSAAIAGPPRPDLIFKNGFEN